MVDPHGGRLVERVCGERTRRVITEQAREFPCLPIDADLVKDVKNICFGVFSPLEGFQCQDDFDGVVGHCRLANDVPWSIPVVLDAGEGFARSVKPKDEILLVTAGKDPVVVAKLAVEDVYQYDKTEYVRNVFKTDDPKHPGVKASLEKEPWLLGGKLDLIAEVKTAFARYNLKPRETRYLFKKRGWKTVAAFQTRNPPHLGHEYVQKSALTVCDGLLINPVIGRKQPGDFTDEVILASYEALIDNYYVKDTCALTTFETEMHYAGPREAVHHAIARKNLGCSHFIVGRDHAGVGSYYGPFDAQEIFKQFPDLGITPINFRAFYKCKKCGSVVSDKICPHGPEFQVDFKGRVVRQMLAEGKIPCDEMRPEVAEAIMRYKDLFVL
ncbi:MAG: sulfate adenylyltransferase [Candidatus Lokiarchaeota archaeon]|nr:sulfate adenylyltransferase [Candidatus Lokiarchaeota archaeon]